MTRHVGQSGFGLGGEPGVWRADAADPGEPIHQEGRGPLRDYVYNKVGNVLTLTYPVGTTIAASYDQFHWADTIQKEGR